MKKLILLVIGAGFLIYLFSCVKSTAGFNSCTGPAAIDDSTALKTYAQQNGITAVHDTSWLYYQIITQGSGPAPVGTSKITVSYVGKYLNGNLFDSTISPVTFELDSLIKGWQYGLPKIEAGGHIKLLVPSALAFGCAGSGAIPSNTPVFFDINLIAVQ